MPRGKRTGGMSKRAFILSLPLDLPGKEVVEQAKQQGIALKETYVYVVRSNSKKPTSANGARARVRTSPDSAEVEFRRLAIELGLGKSKELIRETELKVTALIHGR